MTSAEARFNKSLRPRKPEGSLGRTAQDVHLDSHTAPELCPFIAEFLSVSNAVTGNFSDVPCIFSLSPCCCVYSLVFSSSSLSRETIGWLLRKKLFNWSIQTKTIMPGLSLRFSFLSANKLSRRYLADKQLHTSYPPNRNLTQRKFGQTAQAG